MAGISVFEMLKIGVGPSSSHTMGPWRAAEDFLRHIAHADALAHVQRIRVTLYGSLAKTGKGHGTDIAIMMGLAGKDPVTCDTTRLHADVADIRERATLALQGTHNLHFDPATDIVFAYQQTLPEHPNALSFMAMLDDGTTLKATYYSIGGGFIVRAGADSATTSDMALPYPTENARDVQRHCDDATLPIWQLVYHNELSWRTEAAIHTDLLHLWHTMLACLYRGCHTAGELPGGLRVVRRAKHLHDKLLTAPYHDLPSWVAAIQAGTYDFQAMVQWVSCFALAVNEENAAFGRVVTAPTNGAAGVVPAVLMYYVCFYKATDAAIARFLLVAGEIATLFKKGATISAAMGGCQAEIGVSSAMAAAALTEALGGTVAQALMAAEIAMEHHLGLTCDPIGGLVQVPCIERNAMGAMKAITAASIALESSPAAARVSLDGVILTMWETARDMHTKYKETSEGGLAINIPVNVIEC